MATINQIEYLHLVKERIEDPILIVGSKLYDYDVADLASTLKSFGCRDITGVDIDDGRGVDRVLDICDTTDPFFAENECLFSTVICMEVLTNVNRPWQAAENIKRVTKPSGHIIMSECFVRKLSRMPRDLWRFTYDGFSALYSDVEFVDELARQSLTRSRVPDLQPLSEGPYEVTHAKWKGESTLGYVSRRFHRKLFGGKMLEVSRLLPEQTIYAIGQKRSVTLA